MIDKAFLTTLCGCRSTAIDLGLHTSISKSNTAAAQNLRRTCSFISVRLGDLSTIVKN